MTDYQKIASDMRAEHDARQNALTYSLGDAIKNNPDEYARMKKWSEASGISMDLIAGGDFKAEAQEAAYLQGMNIGKLWEDAPTTAQALTDPDVAGVAHDDVENLSLLERTIRDILPKPKSTLGLPGYNAQGERTGRGAIGGAAHSVRRAGGNFAAGLAVDPNAAVWGWAQGGAQMLQEMTGSDTVGQAADWFGKMRKTSEGIGNKLAGDGSKDGLIEGGIYSGFRSTGMMLPGMVLSIMSGGVSAPALISMGVTAGGQSVGKGLDHGLPAGQALMYGAEDAVAEMATEAIPVAKFLGDLKAGASFWKIIGNQMVREAPTEAVATAWQGANEWMNLNPDKSFGDYIREQGPAQAQTLVAVMTTTLLTGGFGAGYNRVTGQQKKAEQAERNAKTLAQLKELAAVSKVLQRDPATFERFVEDAGGATTVFVDGPSLMQSGLAEQVISAVTPDTAQQIRTAIETGGQAAIPVGEYHARVAPLDESNALLDNIKLDDPDSYTRAEAQQYLQSQVQDMEADMERRASQVEAQDVFRNDAAYIRDRVNEVLTAYGKTSPQANPVLSTLWGNHFATLAQDTGQSVQSLWQQFGLRMGRQKGQQAYGQGSGRTFAAENLATLGDFQTGKPVTFNYVHNTDSATERFGLPQEGDPYQRDIEPSGRYVSAGDLAAGAPANLTGGTLTFNNPLVLNQETWKQDLFNHYQQRGKHLSAALIADGYDGVVTVDQYGTSEILDLTTFDAGKALYQQPAFDGPEIGNTPLGDLAEIEVDGVMRATQNSAGQPIHPTEEGTRNFWRWFGGSKVVDAEGRPLVVYHGTNADFDVFRPSEAMFGEGVYLALQPDYASGFADDSGANVMPLYARITGDGDGRLLWDKRGGIFVAAQPEQVKSATGNRGTFDGSDANILHQSEQNPVSRISGNEFGSGSTSDLRKAAKTWYDETLRGTTVENAASGKQIRFGRGGKAFSASASPLKTKLFAALPDLLRNGQILNSHPPADAARESNVRAYHWLEGVVQVGDELHRVGVTLREDNRGNLYYNHNPLQNETPQTSGLGSTAHKAGAGTNEGGAYNQNIEQVPGDVNLEVLEQGPAARGAFTPANWNIELFKNADLSTFLHESGHFFLEMRLDVANQLQAKVNAGQQLTPGEQRIMRDMQTVMQWFGLRDLNEWNNLDFEERRSYHEQFARGFEAYLFEGKAPNIEMHSLFQRFRAWLLNVYKELEALNVELTDEVRGTFDRMLATDEQIELAEQGRSMLPLFASAEQAGMTTEEFAAYQLLGAEATADAAADLQARGIRDMQWLRNARSKRLKALQAEAKERRAEIEMQVRKEVQQRSVYRVWQFLTNKMTAEDKVPAVEPPKQTRTLNPEVDNLFQAIAKLGGLHRADVESLWGFGKKERSPQAGFGLYVLRKEGHSIEAMTEKLVEAGYLIPDADGQVDPAVFEEKFHEELAGNSQYSIHHDIAAQQEMRAGEQAANLEQLGAGRLDLAALKDMGLSEEVVNVLVARKMTAKTGLHPDLVAELFIDPEMQEPMFESGDALVHYLATANDMQAEIDALTDQRMLEQYGDIATPEALERAADSAIHNDARARMITTEANAINRATGKPKIMLQAAKQYASAAVGRLKVRNVKPLQYSNAEARAARAADKAMKAGDTELAASEKRNQLLNNQLAREAHLAREDVDKGLRYFKKFDKVVKGIDFEYQDQIHQLLERFDLRKGQTRKAVDKRKGLAEWIKAQEDLGMAPNLDPLIAAEAFKTSYLEMTVEEFRGLKDAVEQIEHLGRLKKKLLTAKDQREFNAIAEEAAATIIENGGKAKNVPLEPDRGLLSWARGFLASHRKFSSLMRQMDGGKDTGIMQETLTRTMNDRGTWEAVQQEKATVRLGEIYAPLLELGKLNDKKLVPGTDISLSRAGRMSVLLNMGNQDNMQRLQTTFTPAQLRAIVAQTNEVEAQFVNDVWEFLDSYWPDVAAKEKRLTGKEPGKVEAAPFEITLADGSQRQMRGGYYPIKYDAAASDRAASNDAAQQAKEMMAGAYTRATTRRGHTKARQENVNQKLAFDLNVITQHVQQVTHDLAWHEWLIDANRMLSDKRITGAIRDHYGHEILDTLKDHVKSIATDNLQTMDAMDMVAAYLKGAVARSTMGLSMTTALMQPFGLTQSMYRIGPRYVISGMRHWLGDAARFQNSMREISEKSDFMRLRDKTFNRELAQINATVSKGKGKARQVADASLFYLMQKMQLIADVPTWWGAYDKAIDQGLSEEQAVRMADQAVIESQGGGQTKDLAAVQRNHPFLTMFYSYFSVTYNLMAESTASTNWRSPASIAGWMGDMAMLAVIPAMGPSLLLMLLKGEGSDDDDLATWGKRLLGWQAGYLMSAVVGLREASGMMAGYDYTGPAVTRAFVDAGGLMKQAQQGELDEGLALSSVRLTGTLLGLPTTQAIRSYRGWKAWDEGDAPITSLLVGPPAQD
ncbi:hypothetical protein [Brachymonas wangyanguii]|uniref:LPD3 domain-containing protein n=1 Tax=Brachymonas wangyanguii TaxID=3130163 RepID=UPI00307E2E9A